MKYRRAHDIAKVDVLRVLGTFGFVVERDLEYIGLKGTSVNGTTLLIIPNVPRLKMTTLLTACARAGISRRKVVFALERI